MSGTPKADRVSMGIYLERSQREEAGRIAQALGMTPSQVIRMAVEFGLPEMVRQFPKAAA